MLLARELAMDINEIENILTAFAISPEQYNTLKGNARFNAVLEREIQQWETALNSAERVKLKAVTQIEAWMPELNIRIHDRNESLAAKIEGGKLLMKLAGLGLNNIDTQGSASERFSVTINIGDKRELKFEGGNTPKTIDHLENE